jgi:hypothetical protein
MAKRVRGQHVRGLCHRGRARIRTLLSEGIVGSVRTHGDRMIYLPPCSGNAAMVGISQRGMFRHLPKLVCCLCYCLLTLNSEAQSQSHQDFICSLGAMTRIVSIVSRGSSDRQRRTACRVDYTKNGATKTLWSSETGLAYCAKRATALVTKLVEAHYSCRLETVEQTGDTEAPR